MTTNSVWMRRIYAISVFMALLVLGGWAGADQGEPTTFPKNFCSRFRVSSDPAVIKMVQGALPGWTNLQPRVVDQISALKLVERARLLGMSSLDFFTDQGFRGDCLYYFPKDVLEAISSRYELDLLTPISARDDYNGADFTMEALIAGKSRIVIVYPKEDIWFKNPAQDNRWFKFARVVNHEIASYQSLLNVTGFWAGVDMALWTELYAVSAFRKFQGKAQIYVNGGWVGKKASTPIARHLSSRSAAGAYEPLLAEKFLSPSKIEPSLERMRAAVKRAEGMRLP